MRGKTRKRGEGAHEIKVGRKLVRLLREYQRPNSISLHGEVCLQQCGINPRGQVSIGRHQKLYLNIILQDPKFMRIPLKIIPQEIIDTYDIKALVVDQGWIYMPFLMRMYIHPWLSTGSLRS